MSDTQLQSVERTVLSLAAFGFSAYLVMLGHVDAATAIVGAVSGYWFGQASGPTPGQMVKIAEAPKGA